MLRRQAFSLSDVAVVESRKRVCGREVLLAKRPMYSYLLAIIRVGTVKLVLEIRGYPM